jgi:hypothetical protein
VHDVNDVRPTVGDRRDPLDCHGKLFGVRGIGRYQDVDFALQSGTPSSDLRHPNARTPERRNARPWYRNRPS